MRRKNFTKVVKTLKIKVFYVIRNVTKFAQKKFPKQIWLCLERRIIMKKKRRTKGRQKPSTKKLKKNTFATVEKKS